MASTLDALQTRQDERPTEVEHFYTSTCLFRTRCNFKPARRCSVARRSWHRKRPLVAWIALVEQDVRLSGSLSILVTFTAGSPALALHTRLQPTDCGTAVTMVIVVVVVEDNNRLADLKRRDAIHRHSRHQVFEYLPRYAFLQHLKDTEYTLQSRQPTLAQRRTRHTVRYVCNGAAAADTDLLVL
ncbi:hypothetical protein F4780DRAFT_286387 [Xylariomycetidae sp. FL0641]|nr:hypothetical protein F4780DRAFT_286387 [Xylariomycetidae sp. FL0641]